MNILCGVLSFIFLLAAFSTGQNGKAGCLFALLSFAFLAGAIKLNN